MILNENMPVLNGEINRIPMVDATLTKTGWAADAKEVGEQLRNISGAGELSANAIAKATAAESAATAAVSAANEAKNTAASANSAANTAKTAADNATSFDVSVTVPTTGWTTVAGAAYSYIDIAAEGVLSTHNPVVDFDGGHSQTAAAQLEKLEWWATVFKVATYNGSIRIFATEIPSVDVPIIIKVVR